MVLAIGTVVVVFNNGVPSPSLTTTMNVWCSVVSPAADQKPYRVYRSIVSMQWWAQRADGQKPLERKRGNKALFEESPEVAAVALWWHSNGNGTAFKIIIEINFTRKVWDCAHTRHIVPFRSNRQTYLPFISVNLISTWHSTRSQYNCYNPYTLLGYRSTQCINAGPLTILTMANIYVWRRLRRRWCWKWWWWWCWWWCGEAIYDVLCIYIHFQLEKPAT